VLGVAGAEIAHSGGQCLCAFFLLGWNLLFPIFFFFLNKDGCKHPTIFLPLKLAGANITGKAT
jgi:hypothetical protein